VQSIELPGAAERDREHLLQLLAQKTGEPLDRGRIRDSIRALYATGRFADIQAEVVPSGEGVVLTFTTSPNFFIGAIKVEGAPRRPTPNQIINAAKLQLGELYTRDRLDRALGNIRQLMQEGGFYQARVTAESIPNAAIQQVDILFHISSGPQAHVGEVKVSGTSNLSSVEVQKITHMEQGNRLTASLVGNSMQRLRKRLQKQSRALAQVSIAEQQYHPETNAVDFTFQIDPGPVVVITAEGYHVSRGVLKKEIPVFEENALDDDLLNEGKRNLLDYLQTRGHFDAAVSIQKESDTKTTHVIYQIDPGPVHKLVMVDITGNKEFDTKTLLSRMEIQAATRLLNHGRYSGALLQEDVAMIEDCTVQTVTGRCRLRLRWTTTIAVLRTSWRCICELMRGGKPGSASCTLQGIRRSPRQIFRSLLRSQDSLILNRIWLVIGSAFSIITSITGSPTPRSTSQPTLHPPNPIAKT